MGKVLFVACTPVCRAMIEEIKSNVSLNSIDIVGIVNFNREIAITKANYDSFYDLVLKYNIPVYYCHNINDTDAIEFVRSCAPDIIIQSGWSQKFKNEVLNASKYGCIGEHPAPLPKGRGAACVNWAIITGETEWGDTFFKMEDKYDVGLIYAQKKFTIKLYDNVKTVYDKVCDAASEIIRENIVDWTKGIFNGVPQNDADATYYSRRFPSDGIFSFKESAKNVYNKIRGQTRPYPGAFFQARINGIERNIIVWDANYNEVQTDFEVGRIILNEDKGEVDIICGDGIAITIKRVQVENKTETWGYNLFIKNDIRLK